MKTWRTALMPPILTGAACAEAPATKRAMASIRTRRENMSFLFLDRAARLFLRGGVESDRVADERLEGGLVQLVAFVQIDGAPQVAFEAGIEQVFRVLELGALGEGELDDGLVGFAGADDPAIGPDGNAAPLPLLHDLGIRGLDELSDMRERLAAPIAEFGDPRADKLGGRLGAGGFLHRLDRGRGMRGDYTRSAARRFRLAAGHSLFVS